MLRRTALLLAAGAAVFAQGSDTFFQPKGIVLEQDGGYKGKTFSYTIRKGEDLFAIAERFLGDPYKASVLQKLNDIPDPRRLTPGGKIRIPRPSVSLMYAVQRLANGDLETVGPDYRFQTGDKFQVRLSTNTDGHLYLFNRAANGDVTRLFPSEGRQARVRRFGEYLLPNNGWFVLDAARGSEELLVVVSLEPVEAFESGRPRGQMADAIDLLFGESSAAAKGIRVDHQADAGSVVTAGPDGDTVVIAHRIRMRRN